MGNEIGKDRAEFADHMLDAMFLVDTGGRIQYVSAACEGILGYTPKEITGQSIIDLVVQDDRDRTLLEAREVMAGKKRIGFENRYRHKDGNEVHIMWSAGWLQSERMRVGVARDVTALRKKSRVDLGLTLSPVPLAPHEQKVLQLLLTDASEKQIAQRLGLAVSTTHSYVTTIFRKFGVRGRAGLMSLWLEILSRER
ncbi:PAS domain S-box protein [Cupriavidus oxalaticus]|uniref:helix-turn-helix transcriptional regulator n=1 Tax=Cupriavidus oxalaticus TaxID=96344 RepID=UPI00316B39D2